MQRAKLVGLGLFVAVALLPGSPSLPPARGEDRKAEAERTEAELAALQGTWKCLRWEQEGKPMSDEEAKNVSIVVKGDKYRSTVDGVKFLEGKLTTLDPSRTPGHIDGTFDGGVNRSIYVRTGDYLIMCVGREQRPTRFACGGKDGGDSIYAFKIER